MHRYTCIELDSNGELMEADSKLDLDYLVLDDIARILSQMMIND